MSNWIEPVVPGVDIKKIGRDAQEIFGGKVQVEPDDMLAILHEFGAALAREQNLRVGIGSAASLIWSINPDYKIRPKAMMDVVLSSRLMLLDHFASLLGSAEPWLTEAETSRLPTDVDPETTR